MELLCYFQFLQTKGCLPFLFAIRTAISETGLNLSSFVGVSQLSIIAVNVKRNTIVFKRH